MNTLNFSGPDMPKIPLQNISVTIVYDNNPYTDGLFSGWGFSCLIEGTAKTILFDTGGDSELLLANMKTMAIDPQAVEVVFLSHAHGDHVGGLDGFLEQNKNAVVCLPASVPGGFKSRLANSGVRTRGIQDPVPICPGVYSTGELGIWLKEQALMVHTDRGIVLITGCAHPEIAEIVKTAARLIGDNVLAVVGGFHLTGAKKLIIEEIIYKIKKMGVIYAGPCHCSGDLARYLFKNEFGHKYIDPGVGKIIKFE